mgnify:CR=1 FL=1
MIDRENIRVKVKQAIKLLPTTGIVYRDKKDIWDIEKMIYSKENGVELILFRNGNWYKRN